MVFADLFPTSNMVKSEVDEKEYKQEAKKPLMVPTMELDLSKVKPRQFDLCLNEKKYREVQFVGMDQPQKVQFAAIDQLWQAPKA
jgi:hypothetical protein